METKRDLRHTEVYARGERLQLAIHQPGTGRISDASELHVSPDGQYAVFSGAFLDKLEGKPTSRICRVDLELGAIQVLTFGPNTDRLPRYSPDGKHVAFLSDRHSGGDFQLYLLDLATGAARAAPRVSGWIEYLQWSPDSAELLLGVAGHGADVAGAQGAITSAKRREEVAPWMPAVETGDARDSWRSVWVYSVAANAMRQVSPTQMNVWEASWYGTRSLVVVTSPGPAEGLWYDAQLHLIDVQTGNARCVYQPTAQLGWLAASDRGRHIAFVEGVASDRGVVAGDLRIIDAAGTVRGIATSGVDISCTAWRSERELLLAGHRGFETVVAVLDIEAGSFTEIWSSTNLTTGGRHATVCACGQTRDCLLIGESYLRAPEIAEIRGGRYRSIKSFDVGYSEVIEPFALHPAERIRWNAPDGLEIQGWLLSSKRSARPSPLVMAIHGGPVAQWRPAWLGRAQFLWTLLLLERGYAIFFPNPRGSSGRGQDFAMRVLGDMGGADTYDYLSGIDHLIRRGIADPARLGVAGGSYGGYMTAWLTSQDSRFAAAVASSPMANFVTEHLLSNIPDFVAKFLADTYTNPTGSYFHRSPLMHSTKIRTPMLISCGALDRCTPPEEAWQLHNALRENGAKSMLLTYPQEGHGVRSFPAVLDYAARIVTWFDEHIGASRGAPLQE